MLLLTADAAATVTATAAATVTATAAGVLLPYANAWQQDPSSWKQTLTKTQTLKSTVKPNTEFQKTQKL